MTDLNYKSQRIYFAFWERIFIPLEQTFVLIDKLKKCKSMEKIWN